MVTMTTPRARSPTQKSEEAPGTPHKHCVDQNDHEYLRRHVDPVLMPMIEALLLYQPESIYEFIHDYVDEDKTSRFHGNTGKRVGYAKKLTNRRKMVDFMSTSVIPVMDDLAHQILREKPSSVPHFVKEIIAARIVVGSSSPTTDSNQYEYVDYKVGHRVQCRYKGRPRYYSGQITDHETSDDTFSIQYDDGKIEHHVHRMCLKPELEEANTPRRNSNGSSKGEINQTTAVDAKVTNKPHQTMEIVILIIGIDGAGKTTLLSTLQGDLDKEHVPSSGFTSAKFQTETGSAAFYDLGGGPAFRNVWTEYYSDAHGIMFVVDSSKETSIVESASILQNTMMSPTMTDKPLLIFANKCDQPTALPEDRLYHLLGLSKLNNSKLLPCIAKPSANKSMVDDRLEHGIQWLFDQIHSQFNSLDARVKQDLIVKKRLNDERMAAQRLRVSAWKEERERAGMALHDKVDLAAVAAAKKVETPEEVEIKCSNCTTQAATTKCAASKWMPVCMDCATSLKAAVIAAASNNQ